MKLHDVTVGLALALRSLGVPAAEEPVVFKFDPGDGSVWIESTRVSMTLWPRQVGDRPYEFERVERLRARRSDAGWEIVVEPVSQRADERPRPVVDPIDRAFGGSVRSVTLDAGGAVTSLRLAEEPPTESGRVREVAGTGAVDKILADAWRRRGIGLAGKKGVRGSVWTERVRIPLASGGSLTCKTTWSIEESVPCELGTCVRVDVLWSAELTPLFMALQQDVASRWGGATVNPSGLQRWYVKGKGRLIVHPDGIRVLRRRTEERLSVESAMTRESIAIREVVEVRETTASFDAPRE